MGIDIAESIKPIMNDLAMKLMTMAFIMATCYFISHLILSIVHAPRIVRNFVSGLVMLASCYFSFMKLYT